MISTPGPLPAAPDDQRVQQDQSRPDEAPLAGRCQQQDPAEPDRVSMGSGELALRQLRDDGVI